MCYTTNKISHHYWGEPHINGSALCDIYVCLYIHIWYDRHNPYICCSNLAKYKFSLVHGTRTRTRTYCTANHALMSHTRCKYTSQQFYIERSGTIMNAEPEITQREQRLQRRRERDRACRQIIFCQVILILIFVDMITAHYFVSLSLYSNYFLFNKLLQSRHMYITVALLVLLI